MTTTREENRAVDELVLALVADLQATPQQISGEDDADVIPLRPSAILFEYRHRHDQSAKSSVVSRSLRRLQHARRIDHTFAFGWHTT